MSRREYKKGYNNALKNVLEIAEDVDDTYIIEVIKRKLEL